MKQIKSFSAFLTSLISVTLFLLKHSSANHPDYRRKLQAKAKFRRDWLTPLSNPTLDEVFYQSLYCWVICIALHCIFTKSWENFSMSLWPRIHHCKSGLCNELKFMDYEWVQFNCNNFLRKTMDYGKILGLLFVVQLFKVHCIKLLTFLGWENKNTLTITRLQK